MKHQPRRCICCKQVFTPDPRSRHRQLFCSAPACKKASKALSQKFWHAKPENQNYWRGPDQLERVRAWRKLHPFYWKKPKSRSADVALQDDIATSPDVCKMEPKKYQHEK